MDISDVSTISLHVEMLLKYINIWNTNVKLSKTAQAGRLCIIVVLLYALLASKPWPSALVHIKQLRQCFSI